VECGPLSVLSDPSPKMEAGGQHSGRHSLACLFEYMFPSAFGWMSLT